MYYPEIMAYIFKFSKCILLLLATMPLHMKVCWQEHSPGSLPDFCFYPVNAFSSFRLYFNYHFLLEDFPDFLN